MKKISESVQVILWNMFNDKTCQLHDIAEELHAKGAHSVAARKEALIDELDEIARELGII